MAKTIEYKGFKIGDRVIIKTIENPACENHQQYIGQHGTIKSITKSKDMIWVMCDFGKEYGSYPKNLIKE